MIKYIKIKNFLSIQDEITVDFSSNNRGNKKDNVFKVGKDTLTKNMLLYGANASGKSNILKAINFLRWVAITPDLKLFNTPFLLRENINATSEFEISFFVGKKNYLYFIKIDKNIILEEKLTYINSRKECIVLFERVGQVIKASNRFDKELKKGEGKIKENSSVISILSIFNGFLNKKPISYIFNKINFIGYDINSISNYAILDLLKLNKNNKNKKLLIDCMKFADINIDDIKIEIEDTKISNSNQEKFIPFPIAGEEILETPNGYMKIKIFFGHKIDGNVIKYFSFNQESDGTKKFFKFIGPLIDTILNEKVLFVDEVDSGIHPLILKEILKLINSNIKDKKYQFFFTTHNIDLLDLEILKNDQIAFVEKNKNHSTEFYRLSDIDFPARKELDVKKYYKNGAFGAIPNIKDFTFLLNSYEK